MCIFCRNDDNYRMYKEDKDKSMAKFKLKEIDLLRKNIEKEYLFNP